MSICYYKEMAINGKLYLYTGETRNKLWSIHLEQNITQTVESMYLFISYNQKEF